MKTDPPFNPTASRRDVMLGVVSTAIAAGLSTAAFAQTTSAKAISFSTPTNGKQAMNTIITKDGVEIFYKDWGSGQPIVFHHGWPLSSDDWDAQMLYFV